MSFPIGSLVRATSSANYAITNHLVFCEVIGHVDPEELAAIFGEGSSEVRETLRVKISQFVGSREYYRDSRVVSRHCSDASMAGYISKGTEWDVDPSYFELANPPTDSIVVL